MWSCRHSGRSKGVMESGSPTSNSSMVVPSCSRPASLLNSTDCGEQLVFREELWVRRDCARLLEGTAPTGSIELTSAFVGRLCKSDEICESD